MGGSDNQVWALVRQQENTVRDSLRELLHDMDPLAFEYLIKRLLEEMAYQNVDVTARSNDGGVDVVGEIEVGITSVREVVQAKRHRRPIQRKDLDALRGSLYRFNAVRGTIVTTSRFAQRYSGGRLRYGCCSYHACRRRQTSGLSRLDFRVWALESRGCVMRGELPNAYPSCTQIKM